MYCSKCGNELKDGFLFCDKCGAKVEIPTPPVQKEMSEETATEPIVENNAPVQDTEVPKEKVSQERLDYIMGLLDGKEEETKEESVVEDKEEVSEERLDYIMGLLDNKEEKAEENISTPAEQIIQTQTATSTVEIPEPQVQTQVENQSVNKTIDSTAKEVETPKKSYLGLISLIVGIACIILAFVIKAWVIPFAIAGIVLGALEKRKDSKKVVGIALSVASIILGIVVAIVAGVLGLAGKLLDGLGGEIKTEIENQISEKTFEGDGITLKYDYHWTEVTNNGDKMLEYMFEESYLTQIGKSALSEIESGLDLDFNNDEDKDELYNLFYDYWKEDFENEGQYFGKYSEFKKLKDDIYYATYEYGEDEYEISGNILLLVSKDSNSIVSFETYADRDNVTKLLIEVKELLKTIEITKLDNFVVDEEMGGYLNSMSNWNQYKEIRQAHNNGKKMNLEGEWIILSGSEATWEFKNGEFWFYKSYNDKEDNYWYGTYEYKTGKDGLKLIGIDESRLENMLYQGNGSITAESVYGIVLHPKMIYADGQDKSATNMSGEDWHYVWVIVNHGDEGIEGQIGNVDTAQQQYYVKSQDK